MNTQTRRITLLSPVVGIVAIGALGLAPVVLSAAPASANTSGTSHSISSGDFAGKATMSLPRSKSQRMNLDDAYVSVNRSARSGRLDALMAKGSSYAEVNLTYVGGKITGGSIRSNVGTSRILRGSLNGGRGISTHNRLVMKTSTGTVVTHLDLVRR